VAIAHRGVGLDAGHEILYASMKIGWTGVDLYREFNSKERDPETPLANSVASWPGRSGELL
jgi:hypothetical protein